MNRRKFISVLGGAAAAVVSGLGFKAAAPPKIVTTADFNHASGSLYWSNSFGFFDDEEPFDPDRMESEIGAINYRMGREAAKKMNDAFWKEFMA